MNRFYYVVLLTFMLVLPESALAQQALIRGFVTDASSEQPLQGTTVALFQSDRLVLGTATDGDGYFILNRIRPGTYELRVSFIGFSDVRENMTFSAGELIERSFVLLPKTAEIGELVVEAEKEGGVTTVIAGLESVVPAEIRRVPVPGVSGDLAAYLQTVPGVVVQGDRGGQLFVRGGAVDQNMAFLDGIPVYMPFHILSVFSAFPEELVDRADFYTGGFSAQYGTRVSSMLDVHARNGNKQNLAGSLALAPFLSSATIEGPLVKGRVSMIASVRQSLIEELFPSLVGQKMPYRFGDRFGKIHALLGSSHSISFTALDSEDRGDIAGTKKSVFGETEASEITDSTEVAWTNRVFGGTYTYRSNRIPLVAVVTAGSSQMTNEFGPEDDVERRSTLESIDVKTRLTYQLKGADVSVGSTYRNTKFSLLLDDLFTELTSTKDELQEISSYAESTFELAGGNVSVNPGVHVYTLPERSQNWIEPRFRMSYWPMGRTGRHQINASWGIFHQAISGLSDERDLGNIFYAWVTTPENAKATEAQHAILGWNVKLFPWMNAALEGYYKSYDNLSVPIFSPFPKFTTTQQAAKGTAFGFDARLNVENRPFWFESVFDGYVSYAYSKVEYETASYTYNPSHDRRHQLNALLHAQKGEVGMTVQFQYGSGLPFTQSGGFDVWYLLTPGVDVTKEAGIDRILYSNPYSGRQPAYSRVDVWLERRVEKGRYVVTMRAGAVNLFNRNNLFYYDLFTFKRVDQLPFLPSVGFKVEFR
jgi:hypothetical protein